MTENKFILKYLAEKISLKKMAGSLDRISSVLAKSTIDLNPHQIRAALYAFNSPLSRGAILADEVGLGKTIEAGIVISQLWAEGKRKILILAPASLRSQWQDELLTKFGLESEVWDGPSFTQTVNSGGDTPFTYEGIFIVSYQFVYSHLGLVEKQDWDVVIIDEAHRFRRVFKGRDASKMAYEIREIIKDKPKVLLTATPLQNGLEELFGIASFIDDKLLGTFYSFQTRFINPIKQGGNQAKIQLEKLRQIIKGDEVDGEDSVSGIVSRTLRKQVLQYVPFTDRSSLTFDFTPNDDEAKLYEDVSEYLKRPDIAAITHTQRNLMILVYRKLLASSSFAIAGTLEKLVQNLKDELKLRNKDAVVETTVDLDLIEDDGLEEEFEEYEGTTAVKLKKEKQRVSSLYTDEDINQEITELQEYLKIAKSINDNTKGNALVSSLEQLFKNAESKSWPQKAVVFTESRRTQNYLANKLREKNFKVTEFSGTNNTPEARKAFEDWKKEFPDAATQGSYGTNVRQALVNEFKNKSEIFLTTEAGSEGLNLQFCNIVINYDLPWNPQRVEQRIGRCHRYGQKYQVIVANFLNTRNYADKRVLQLLQEKLNLFDGLFGSSDEILGALESGVDFEKRILDIYQNCKSPEEYDIAFKELQDSLKSEISTDIVKMRAELLEQTDQSVTQLFKKTALETQRVISDYDSELLELVKLEQGGKLKEVSEFIYKTPEFPLPIAFRELEESEIGKISRASNEHPLVQKIIEKSLNIKTSPIPSITFNLSSHSRKISQIETEKGKDGYIFLWKLKINGVEPEEVIAPLAIMKSTKKLLDIAIATDLLTVSSTLNSKSIDKSPIDQKELFNHWEKWKDQVLEKYRKRNERLFDRESDRINRYYDSLPLKIDDKAQKLEKERREIDRKKDNSSDFNDRNKYRRRIEDINIQLEKLDIQKLKIREDSAEQRKKELEALWKKLEMETEEELIAVTHFEIK